MNERVINMEEGNMEKKWQGYSFKLRESLRLELSPVAVSCLKEPITGTQNKLRICRAMLDAAKGTTLQISKENNACFGAAWHLGFHRLSDPKTEKMVKMFVVEGEKLFASYQALENLISQMQDVPDNSASYFTLAPMDKCGFRPDIVVFVCNPDEACRLLTLVTFMDGNMPKIKIRFV